MTKINEIFSSEEEGISDAVKFESCVHRSPDALFKKSCCTSSGGYYYYCKLKNIFPLLPITHCAKCDDYKKMQ